MKTKVGAAFAGVPAGPRSGILFVIFVLLAWLAAGGANAAGTDSTTGTREVRVNRTLPQVEPPKTVLEFSASPTVEDIFRAHVFQEPLVVVGGEPTAAENAALAAALLGYARRSGPDDFSALTDFLKEHPQSPWAAALLTDLGLEYYHTAHYSLALEAWRNAWSLAGQAKDAKAVALVGRAFGELLRMDSRLGRMDELERLLNSIGHQAMAGPASQRVIDAREALWDMQNRPHIAFRCGPLALRSIRIALGLPATSDAEILKCASTQRGCSLPQVAELSRRIGLNYQMAFRNSGDFVVPSVVHWKVGHYAALVRKVGELYELQDPTFGNKTWATKGALEAEASGYFLVAPGALPAGWRAVNEAEGATVWGKGETTGNDPQHIAKNDLAVGGSCPAQGTGMATAKIHLMDVNLHLGDHPLGYTPPVGPTVRFSLDYNLRDEFQPANFNYGNLGPQWTSDWFTYLTDDPANLSADVNLYVAGGGQRTYTGFDTNTQSYAFQQYDWNLLTRTSVNPIRYQLLSGDGSLKIFSQSDGAMGSSRNVFLTQEIDPQGNALTFTYNTNLCLVAVQDAIGQVTTLTYGLASTNIGPAGPNQSFCAADPYKLTSVTDPFGRTATFNYEPQVVAISTLYVNGQPFSTTSQFAWGLVSDTDVIGLTSQFGYLPVATSVSVAGSIITTYYINLINSLTTPYGTTLFNGVDNGNTRTMDLSYPDGSMERVEYYQAYVYGTNQGQSDPILSVPTGMTTFNNYLLERDAYYWDRNASALALGDFSKARQFHFCHTESGTTTSGALESMKPPLEGRIWYDYAGQDGGPQIIGRNTLPLHAGRVLDDGTTQLYSFAYNPFGQVTNAIDPVGRTATYNYDTNGIDLLTVRQTRAGNNELLLQAAYNPQHRPLSTTDPAGQTTTFSYNPRGQVLTVTDPKQETATFTYDSNGYLLAIHGPLADTTDTVTATYDSYGRVRTFTDINGYTVTYDYDDLDRVTRLTYPDGTFSQFTYDRLDCVAFRDRAGRQTTLQYDNMRQLAKRTDPLGRTTLFQWCRCGSLKSLTDPMGRTTSWLTDVESRRVAKQYSDGSQVQYFYENTMSRLQQYVDERGQATVYAYNLDNTLRTLVYPNAIIQTPSVNFSYDLYYRRLTSMTDGIGTTTYVYNPINAIPTLGAGKLAKVDGPLTNQTVTYAYDGLGRLAQDSVDGAPSSRTYDAAGRITAVSNLLGAFAYTYAASSSRVVAQSFPNGQAAAISYGGGLQDFLLQQVAYSVGTTPVSQFSYGYDYARGRITTWSQQAGAQPPSTFSFLFDAADQLVSTAVTNGGSLVESFAYTYDPAGNRLSGLAGASAQQATYNALNQISTATTAGAAHTNEWDAAQRLTAVNVGSGRTEFGYDGLSRLVYIRQLQGGAEISLRRFVWYNGRICEERDASGSNLTKRFFAQGVELLTGTNAGAYYYTRDHLGSIRELTDVNGNVRARYSYDPFGSPTKVGGDVDADFGFAGMFWSPEASLALTRFRAYDPELGRWLSRDPLMDAELQQGPNLYAYVGNEPVSNIDPQGLCTGSSLCACYANAANAAACAEAGILGEQAAEKGGPQLVQTGQQLLQAGAEFLEGGGAQAPSAINCSQNPAVQSAVVNLAGRLGALAERVPDARAAMQTYLSGGGGGQIMQLGAYEPYISGYTDAGRAIWQSPDIFEIPPSLWSEVADAFDQLALELAQWGATRAGGSTQDFLTAAKQWLLNHVGDPWDF